tara:strand:+ start:628 stop:1242 length:615 start_codon:yes stop_codon:yes gene_type:complete
MIGDYFVDKCTSTAIENAPWPHQHVADTLPKDSFKKLRECCEKIVLEDGDPKFLYAKDFKDYNIDFEDEIYSIAKAILENAKVLCGQYPKYRWFQNLDVNAHIAIIPPLHKFKVHHEARQKIWSSITYITPEKNIGTKMYTAQNEKAFIKEAVWNPNSTFIFCGQKGKTWHSYESDQTTNRITLCLFLVKTTFQIWKKVLKNQL